MTKRFIALFALALLISAPVFADDKPASGSTNSPVTSTVPNQTPAPAPAAPADKPAAAAPSSAPAAAPAQAPADDSAKPADIPATDTQTKDPANATAPDHANPLPDLIEPEVSKKAGTGGKDDVDAIGNRNVGKRGLGNWYSIESDIKMGKQYAQMVEQSSRMVTDPVVNEYVNRIGQNLVRNSDAKVPFTIKVIDSDEINAFALPGGFFFVNSGLILAADEEAELAGVMAHEIAHVAARHAARQQTRGNWANIMTIPLIFVGGGVGYAARSLAGLALPMTFMSFSRGYESEADYLGTQYMYATGYDPQAAIQFFEKIHAKEKKKPGTIAKAFSTHPPTGDRIESLQKEISTILPAREQYVVSSSEFDEVKTRLAALVNRRKLNDEKDDGSKPTLRKKAADSKTGDKTDDDKPTLKRRN